MPALTEPLARALAAGATVVTPNKRLARRFAALYDAGERAAGRFVWPAARAMPWDSWLVALWHEALAAGAVPAKALLMTPLQATRAWNTIVARDAHDLVDPAGAAALAADAWSLSHAWGAGGDSWRGFGDPGTDDVGRFVRWADRFAKGRVELGQIDFARLPERLCAWSAAMPTLRGAAIVLAGFAELTPQQERLAAALARAGASVSRLDSLPREPGRVFRATGRTPADEVARALAWARARALADPGATVGVAVQDLATRREEIRALAEDVLCPASQWPDALGDARPYNLSLGAPLADVSMVATALGLLHWCADALPVGEAGALLRSPHVAAVPDRWTARASLERTWLDEGRRSITMQAAIAGLRGVDAALADRWSRARDAHPLPARGSPREHVDAWRRRLRAMGWPGERPQEGAEYQAAGAWDEALAEFATLDRVEPRLTRADALAALRAHLGSVVFQPEAPPAPIQILGVLEAAGQPFDALWVAGLAAEHWPAAPRLHPLLPVSWQRERGAPGSSAVSELAFAKALTDAFARAAPEVVFSHAQRVDDHELSPSALLPRGIELPDVGPPASSARGQFDVRPMPDPVADDMAPPPPAGAPLRGGASFVEAQSECPFKAVATYRLRVAPWPEPVDGLSAMERGSLVHAALAAFWREVRTHAALRALAPGDLAAAATLAAAESTDALGADRWRELEPVVAAGEEARIARLVERWLVEAERDRPPFVVGEREIVVPLPRGPLPMALELRIDRVDDLEGGGTAIIDYKTGRTSGPDSWFGPRPRALQLALYVLARRAVEPGTAVRAVAYGQLKPGELGFKGIAAEGPEWRGLKLPSSLRNAGLADWESVEVRWRDALAMLGAEIATGRASVEPRDRDACARCSLQPLCRIGSLDVEARTRGDDE